MEDRENLEEVRYLLRDIKVAQEECSKLEAFLKRLNDRRYGISDEIFFPNESRDTWTADVGDGSTVVLMKIPIEDVIKNVEEDILHYKRIERKMRDNLKNITENI